MNPHLRKSLGLPDDTPIKFWLHYWRECVKNYANFDSYDFRLDNPHFLIEDILSEIEYNGFKNKENRQYFKSILGKCMREDSVFSTLCRTQCKLAFQSWDTSPLYIKTLCVDMLQRIKDRYVKSIVGVLTEMIDNSTGLDSELKRKICKYTNFLISELIAQGINTDDISSFIDEEQARFDAAGNIISVGDIFHDMKKLDFPNEEEYHKSIVDFMKNRKAKDFMENLLLKYNQVPQKANVLIRVDGIKGKANFKIQEVHFYSVDQVTYIDDKNSHSEIEKPQPDFEYVNIAVPVQHKYFHSSFEYA